ncbi:hypothetical protein HPT29_020350 [Microvirga terrae]|uniref:Uncharacterized protein n=1 Tax=Microvirga terrae TaxID=2740529 RepID=A0ABY5RNI8_9HYPH|nr:MULTISPECIES: hypothetical protein [Microvirga]MBQ0821673.1 hypothetical protein [Microvirga sp. HBU67558]UVF18811.1 hypothetical protein HPT29_020350 [Microvirga terrae]
MRFPWTAALAICVAGLTAAGTALSAELMQGRCRMDYCAWFSIESRDIVGSNSNGGLFKVISREWTSHHPNGSYDRRRPRTGGEASTGYYFCSKTKPSAIWQGDTGRWKVALLNLASPSGAEENAVIEYFAVCHGVQTGHDTQDSFGALTERFGYAPAESADLRDAERPEDVLKD